jgi:diguanylate cyclase (GGDEF)-like protein
LRQSGFLSLTEQRYMATLLGVVAFVSGGAAILLHGVQSDLSLPLQIMSATFTALGVLQLLLARYIHPGLLTYLMFINVPLLFIAFWYCLYPLDGSSLAYTSLFGLATAFPVVFCLQFVLLRPSDAFFWTVTEIVTLLLISLPRAVMTAPTEGLLGGGFLPVMLLTGYGSQVLLLKYVADLVRKLRVAKEETAQLEEVAFYDVLTGLLNRRGTETFLQQVMADAGRTQDAFSIALLDLDHFKAINDTYGHLVGDDILRQFSGQFKTSLRAGDVLGRWGGEEFLLIALHTPASLHATLAQRLKESWQHPTVTFSAGLTVFQKGDTLQSLIQRADEALYLAKSKGRDRIEWAHGETMIQEDAAMLKN